MMAKETIDFNLIDAGITKEKFKEITMPLLLEIVKNLLDKLKGGNPLKKIAVAEVKSALDKYLEPEKVTPNPLYSDLVIKALFKIGNFDIPQINNSYVTKTLNFFGANITTEKIVTWSKATIAEQASIAFHDVESSYHQSIKSLVEVGNEHLLNAETLKKIFFPPSLSEEEETHKKESVRQNLASNIHRISALAHDALYRSLESTSAGSIKASYAPSTASLENAISNVYHKILGSAVLNKSLLANIFEVVDKGLKKAVENHQATTKLESKVTTLDANSGGGQPQS